MNIDFDPIQRKLVNGPEAGANVEVDGFTVSVIGGGSGTETLYNAGTGIAIEGSTITNTMAGSGRIAIDGGTASFIPSADIVNVTGTSVTLQPDTAYKIYATSQAITLNANPPAAGKWAYEGHLEIFVAGTGYVQTGSNVVLTNALEPDAVNNCTVRFHDGKAIISVEDHIAGYVVTVGSGTTAGTLPYALHDVSDQYISFDASLNGQTLDLAGATTYAGEKHVVGNGYSDTILSGGIVCTSKTTFSNLSMDGVVASGGTMTLGDVNIPNGATVAVSGGGLAIEKVTGAGSESVIDLNNTRVMAQGGQTLNISGCAITGGTNGTIAMNGAGAVVTLNGCFFSGNTGGAGAATRIYNVNTAYITGCTYSGNTVTAGAELGVVAATYGGELHLSSCTISGNTLLNNIAVHTCFGRAWVELKDCTIEGNVCIQNNSSGLTSAVLAGSNTFGMLYEPSGNHYCTVTISSGAIIDLTGNTNATPIAPGDGIVIGSNVQIYPSAGSASAVTIGGGTFTAITNGGVLNGPLYFSSGETISGNATIDLNNTRIEVRQPNVTISGVTITGGSASAYGGGCGTSVKMSLVNVVFTGNKTGFRGAALSFSGGAWGVVVSGCTFTNNINASTKGSICLINDNSPIFSDCFFDNGENIVIYTTTNTTYPSFAGNIRMKSKLYAENGSATLAISSGTVLDLTGNTNATPIAPGGGVVVDGGCTVITSAGSTVSIAGGTYTQINNDGTTE